MTVCLLQSLCHLSDTSEDWHNYLVIRGQLKILIVKEKITRLAGCQVKSIRLIFKTELLIYQSKAKLDETIFVW